MNDIPIIIPPTLPPISIIPDSRNIIAKTTTDFAGYLQQGKLLNAVVLRNDSNGNVILNLQGSNAPLGEIAVTSKIPLPQGSNLVLRLFTPIQTPQQTKIPISESTFKAQILSINNNPPDPVAYGLKTPQQQAGFDIIRSVSYQTSSLNTIATPSQPQVAPQTSATSGASIVSLSNGVILDAVVIKPSPGADMFLPKTTTMVGGNLITSPGQINPSDGVTLHILSSTIPSSVKPEAVGGQASPQITPWQATFTTNNASPQENANHIATYKQLPSSEFSIAPHVQKSTISPITSNPSFIGTVIGTEKSGEVVLKTPIGTIALPTDISLPKGTRLELEVVSIQSRNLNISLDPTETIAKSAAKTMSAANAAITELTSLLLGFDAELGSSLAKGTLPHPEKQMVAKLLWFIVNVNNADATTWLGPQVKKMLEQYDQKELLGKLEKAFTTLKMAFSEPNIGGWNTLQFPVFDGSKLQFGQFYIRRDGKNNKQDGSENNDVRFVVDVGLDQLGEIQIDGFVKQKLESKTLDLFIRTKEPLADQMQADIYSIFSESIESTGIEGSLQFQIVKDFPIHPADDSSNNRESGIVV